MLALNDSTIWLINRDIAAFFLLYLIVATLLRVLVAQGVLFSSKEGRAYRYYETFNSIYWEVLVIFILRGFFYEMYIIPSSSMEPTVYPGHVVLVEKYTYGFKMPLTNTTLFKTGLPKRGDVVVFLDPTVPTKRKMIKRAIGLPGDHIVVKDERLYVNGAMVSDEFEGRSHESVKFGHDQQVRLLTKRYQEALDNRYFHIKRTPLIHRNMNVDCVVPEGHYFVLGDNRDNSQDSRYWGFVPERFLCGKAFRYVGITIGQFFEEDKDAPSYA